MLAAFNEVGVGGEDLADGTRLWVVTKAGEGILVEGEGFRRAVFLLQRPADPVERFAHAGAFIGVGTVDVILKVAT